MHRKIILRTRHRDIHGSTFLVRHLTKSLERNINIVILPPLGLMDSHGIDGKIWIIPCIEFFVYIGILEGNLEISW